VGQGIRDQGTPSPETQSRLRPAANGEVKGRAVGRIRKLAGRTGQLQLQGRHLRSRDVELERTSPEAVTGGASGRSAAVQPRLSGSAGQLERQRDGWNGEARKAPNNGMQLARGAWWWCILSCRLGCAGGAREGRPLAADPGVGHTVGWKPCVMSAMGDGARPKPGRSLSPSARRSQTQRQSEASASSAARLSSWPRVGRSLSWGISIPDVGSVVLAPAWRAAATEPLARRLRPAASATRLIRSGQQKAQRHSPDKGHEGVQQPVAADKGRLALVHTLLSAVGPAGRLRLRGAREGRPLAAEAQCSTDPGLRQRP